MKIQIEETYQGLSKKAKDFTIDEIQGSKNLLLCTATGGSPTGTYQLLGEEYLGNPELFSGLRVIKLDEWAGVPMDNKATCETYLQQHVINPLKISTERYIGFDSEPADPTAECQRIEHQLEKKGPIDLCILGIGMNGHIGFNKPADYLEPNCHVAKLSDITLGHEMASELDKKRLFGLTLGMANILNSKKILLLLHGSNKKKVVKEFLSRKITTLLPASLLWLHNDVTCIIDKTAMD